MSLQQPMISRSVQESMITSTSVDSGISPRQWLGRHGAVLFTHRRHDSLDPKLSQIWVVLRSAMSPTSARRRRVHHREDHCDSASRRSSSRTPESTVVVESRNPRGMRRARVCPSSANVDRSRSCPHPLERRRLRCHRVESALVQQGGSRFKIDRSTGHCGDGPDRDYSTKYHLT